MYENNITRFMKNHENIELEEKFEIYFENNYVVFEDSVMDLQDILFYTSAESLFSEVTSWCASKGETPYLIIIDKKTEEVECFRSEKDFNEWKTEVFVYWIEDLLSVKLKQIYNTYDEYTLEIMRIVYTWDYYKATNLINDMVETNEEVIKWIDICTK